MEYPLLSDILMSIAAQFPLLILFVVYNERKDKLFHQFLTEQRSEYVSALGKLSDKMENHDTKCDTAIATMVERTRPKTKTGTRPNPNGS